MYVASIKLSVQYCPTLLVLDYHYAYAIHFLHRTCMLNLTDACRNLRFENLGRMNLVNSTAKVSDSYIGDLYSISSYTKN